MADGLGHLQSGGRRTELREFVLPSYHPERHYMRGPGPGTVVDVCFCPVALAMAPCFGLVTTKCHAKSVAFDYPPRDASRGLAAEGAVKSTELAFSDAR